MVKIGIIGGSGLEDPDKSDADKCEMPCNRASLL